MKRLTEALIVIGIALLLAAIIRVPLERIRASKKPTPVAAVAPVESPSDPYDYVMKSLTARSNAMYFGKPPDGIQIVCDDSGRYAPREIWSEINPNAGFVWGWNGFVRTNRQDAIVSAWRVKEILDNRNTNSPTPPPPIVWKPCE